MKLLDIHYIVDLDKNQDHNYIEKCLEIYIKTKHREYEINKFEKYELNKENINEINNDKNDIIKNGINIFNDMYYNLKLKTANDVWFFYISNGNIRDKYKNISVILLNKCPMMKKTNYVITKNRIDVNINYTKQEKLKKIKNITDTLDHLFNSNKVIQYN
jgi:hypothetical protein